MGFRFRKSLSLLPGIRVNLSKSGASLSLGEKGATYNIGEKGNRATVGLPGSGMSYSTYEKRGHLGKGILVLVLAIIFAAIKYFGK